MPIENPKLFMHLLGRIQAAALARAEAFLRLGVDGVFVEEFLHLGGISSLRSVRAICAPLHLSPRRAHPRLWANRHALHDGGRPAGLPHVVQLAPTALAVEEPKKGYRLDLGEIAAAIGQRFAVFGNLDATRIRTGITGPRR